MQNHPLFFTIITKPPHLFNPSFEKIASNGAFSFTLRRIGTIILLTTYEVCAENAPESAKKDEENVIQYEELKLKLEDRQPELKELAEAMGLAALKEEQARLEEQSAQPDFWDDMDNSQKVLRKISGIKNRVAAYQSLADDFEETLMLIEIADEEGDLSHFDEAKESVDRVLGELENQKLSTLLTGEYDQNNAILTFHAGAGGTEAQDWAEMLYRMYTRFAERRKFKVKVLDYLDGDEAGIKSVSMLISGENAYGYLKSESGVHRLVRVSPFDASGRRHTSFASVEVLPEFNDETDIEINEADLKIDAHRSSGAGGQHVNKTDSAIRITHLPTGIVVGCQTERSQVQNRETAMRMLKSKLLEIKEREKLERIEDITGAKLNIEWGSQIRSYVFMPYTLVKDNRTGWETGNIAAVMDGEIDDFINEYLKMISKKK